MTLLVDMGGNDLVVNTLAIGATTPGASGTNISAAELSVLDSVTAGTTSASKAIVVDANKQVAGLGIPQTVTAGGATKTLAASNGDQIIALDTAGGSVVTLPAATGSGVRFKFLVTVLATSNSHIVYTDGGNSGVGTGVFKGIISGHRVDSGNAVLAFASSTNDTITLNRTTTGSVTLGEWIEVIDIAANVWHVRGVLSATGAAFATPFSTT